jgi:hypothetical protein
VHSCIIMLSTTLNTPTSNKHITVRESNATVRSHPATAEIGGVGGKQLACSYSLSCSRAVA